MPRRVASAIAARFASGRVQRLSSSVPSMSSAMSFTAIPQLYRGLDVFSGARVLWCSLAERQNWAVLDFSTYDYGYECNGAGMLRMRQKIRCGAGTALMRVWQATAGSLRPEAGRNHTHPRESFETRANVVALSRGAATGRTRNFRRG